MLAVQIGTDPETGEPIYEQPKPGTIPGFDVNGHAIPDFPASGENIPHDEVINGVPFQNGQPVVDVPKAYLNPTYSPAPASAKVTYVNTYQPPQMYKPGSTMWNLGFTSEDEYTGQAARLGRGKLFEERQKEAAKPAETKTKTPEPKAPEQKTKVNSGIIVVGVGDNQLIVRDKKTGEIYYREGTPAQLAEAKKALEIGEGKYDKPYISPDNVSPTKPKAGSFVSEPTGETVTVWDYKGQQLKVDKGKWNKLAGLLGKEQFDLSVEIGLIPKGSEYVAEGNGEWSYLPEGTAHKEQKDQEQNTAFEQNNVLLDNGEYVSKTSFNKLTKEQQDYLKANGVKAFNAQSKQSSQAPEPKKGEQRADNSSVVGLAGDSKTSTQKLTREEFIRRYVTAHGMGYSGETALNVAEPDARKYLSLIAEAKREYGEPSVYEQVGLFLQSRPLDTATAEEKKTAAEAAVTPSERTKRQQKEGNAPWMETSDFVDRYFQEKGWSGGSDLPSIFSYTPSEERKVMRDYGEHLREARDAYIATYGSVEFTRDILANLVLKTLEIVPVHLLPGGAGVYAAGVGIKAAIGRKGVGGVTGGEYIGGALDTFSFLSGLKEPVSKTVVRDAKGNIVRLPTGQPVDTNPAKMYPDLQPQLPSTLKDTNPYVRLINPGETISSGGYSTTASWPVRTDVPKSWTKYSEQIAKVGDKMAASEKAKALLGVTPKGQAYSAVTVSAAGGFTPEFSDAIEEATKLVLNNPSAFPDIVRVKGVMDPIDAYAAAARLAKEYFNSAGLPITTGKAIYVSPEVLDKFRIVTGTLSPSTVRTFPIPVSGLVTPTIHKYPYRPNSKAAELHSLAPTAAEAALINKLKHVPVSKSGELYNEWKRAVAASLAAMLITVSSGKPVVGNVQTTEAGITNVMLTAESPSNKEPAPKPLTVTITNINKDISQQSTETTNESTRINQNKQNQENKQQQEHIQQEHIQQEHAINQSQEQEHVIQHDIVINQEQKVEISKGGIIQQPIRISPGEMPKIEEGTKKKLMRPGGRICWKQGFMWVIVKYPYKKQSDISYSRKAPEGAYVVKGVGSAYRTIQLLTGEAPNFLTVSMGAFTVTIKGTGERGSLKFTRKRKGQSHDLTLKGVRAV